MSIPIVCNNRQRRRRLKLALLLQVIVSLLVAQVDGESTRVAKKKVAIIGGGVTGAFASKYLVDYDDDCVLESIKIFDPNPMSRHIPLNHDNNIRDENDPDYWQGSRVASVQLQDGTLLELGASIAYKGFHHFIEMLDSDDTLEQGRPFYTGKEDAELRTGFGVYSGGGYFGILTSNSPSLWTKLKMLCRYNIDFIRLTLATTQTETSFALIYNLLKNPHTVFESPDEMWDAVGLLEKTRLSFSDYLDSIGIQQDLPWWRTYLPYQGSLREELVTAINLCNYNQDNSQLNALVGLGSFATTKGGLFSIVGGNHQILQSSINQANENHKSKCDGATNIVQHVQERVTTVVGGLERNTLQVYASNQLLGEFDVVILAAPIQQARVSFLIQSHMDSAVLQPMPLNGMVDAGSSDNGHDVLPKPLPSIATRPYTSVVTTVLSGVDMEAVAQHFSLDVADIPRSILVTTSGKQAEHNITAVTQVSSSGVYKVFSSGRLDETLLQKIFGERVAVEHVQVWGGPHGGATPDFRGEGSTMKYLLYDGGQGLEGHTGAAVFYANAIEASFACMELSAIGAKSVAKLAARHLGLLVPTSSSDTSDEL